MTDINQTGDEVEINEMETQNQPEAEQKSIDSVKKAENAGKTAPKRKGDNSNSESMPKVEKPAGVKEEAEEAEAEVVAEEETISVSEELAGLMESEATLSEEFKEKTAIIFETAVKSAIAEEVARLEENYKTELSEEVTTIRSELVEKVDSYLNYVVEQWMEQNELAIQSGLRAEIAEDFMGKLKDLFVESYIEVPESKVDLVDELAEEVESLEGKLNETTEANMKLAEEVKLLQAEAVLAEASRGLADTQAEKLANLAETVEFESVEDFAKKLDVIKESYFTKAASTQTLEESSDIEGETEVVETSDTMAAYLQAIKKINK